MKLLHTKAMLVVGSSQQSRDLEIYKHGYDIRTRFFIFFMNINRIEFQSELLSWENIYSNGMNLERKNRSLHHSQEHNIGKKNR